MLKLLEATEVVTRFAFLSKKPNFASDIYPRHFLNFFSVFKKLKLLDYFENTHCDRLNTGLWLMMAL